MSYDKERLQALSQYEIIDINPEETFAQLALSIFNTNSAPINFIDN